MGQNTKDSTPNQNNTKDFSVKNDKIFFSCSSFGHNLRCLSFVGVFQHSMQIQCVLAGIKYDIRFYLKVNKVWFWIELPLTKMLIILKLMISGGQVM